MPTVDSPCVDLRLPARPDSVPRSRLAVVEMAREQGFADSAVHAIAVAVSEAASNVVRHAYEGAPEPGSLILRASMQGDDLVVGVCDDGPGVRPRMGQPGLGLGLALIAALAAHMEIGVDEQGRNCVSMRFGRTTGPTSLRTTSPRFSRPAEAAGA